MQVVANRDTRKEKMTAKKKIKVMYGDGVPAEDLGANLPPEDMIEPEWGDDDIGVGAVIGTATGEQDRDVTAGGWAGTDDATSTAPSDLSGEDQKKAEPVNPEQENPDASIGRAYGGGISPCGGGNHGYQGDAR